MPKPYNPNPLSCGPLRTRASASSVSVIVAYTSLAEDDALSRPISGFAWIGLMTPPGGSPQVFIVLGVGFAAPAHQSLKKLFNIVSQSPTTQPRFRHYRLLAEQVLQSLSSISACRMTLARRCAETNAEAISGTRLANCTKDADPSTRLASVTTSNHTQTARRWFQLAARLMAPNAQSSPGSVYAECEGVPRDFGHALMVPCQPRRTITDAIEIATQRF